MSHLHFYVFAVLMISVSGSYLGLVEFFDSYTVNNSSHRSGCLCLQTRIRTIAKKSLWSHEATELSPKKKHFPRFSQSTQ